MITGKILNWLGIILTVVVIIYLVYKGFYELYNVRNYNYISPWQCIGYSYPVRLNKEADVQCMSIDGVNCIGGDCNQNLGKKDSELNPKTCKDKEYLEGWCRAAGKKLLKW